MQAKVREANDEANNLREQLEEVEDEKVAIQKILSQTQVAVSNFKFLGKGGSEVSCIFFIMTWL